MERVSIEPITYIPPLSYIQPIEKLTIFALLSKTTSSLESCNRFPKYLLTELLTGVQKRSIIIFILLR